MASSAIQTVATAAGTKSKYGESRWKVSAAAPGGLPHAWSFATRAPRHPMTSATARPSVGDRTSAAKAASAFQQLITCSVRDDGPPRGGGFLPGFVRVSVRNAGTLSGAPPGTSYSPRSSFSSRALSRSQ